MRDFKRLRVPGLLAALAGCQPDSDAAALPTSSKGGPNEPDAPAVPQPSPTTALPTTTSDEHASTGEVDTSTTSSTSSTSGEPGTTSEATSTAGPALEGCGDGIVDPGSEQCDHTYQHNSDSAACTSTCKMAVCGDGLLWQGEEQCDHGANNNDASYGGCTESCTLGPRCGDGVRQPDDEECDASAEPIEGEAPCDPVACRFMARVAFVTALEYPGALGGLALADATCATAAAAAGLDNASSFKAWLSDGVATAQGRLKNAAADVGYPYARRDGQLLADDLADLIAHGPKIPLDITETGVAVPTTQFVWTNIGADGECFSAVNHCKEWTSQAVLATARIGQISPASAAELPAWKAAHRWTSDAALSCKSLAHLYCFED
jgi:hypothetical protein